MTLANSILAVMLRDILRSIAAPLLLFTFLFVGATPFGAVTFDQEQAVDSCCYPADNHDEPSQPCDTASGCSCLFCLHIDLRQTPSFFYRPLTVGLSDFPLSAAALPDFPQTIDYPPERG